MTIKELLGVDGNTFTVDDITTILTLLLSSRELKSKIPPDIYKIIEVTSSSALVLLKTYDTIMDVYKTAQSLLPVVEAATQAGAVVMNPPMAAEIAQKGLMMVAAEAVKQAGKLPQTIIDSVLNITI